jgi:adenylate cyclase class 2
MIEREVKLAFEGPGQARAAILASGAVPFRARRLQDDTLYDTTSTTLRTKGAVLRLRADGEDGAVTFKDRVLPSDMKVREEYETHVGDLTVLRRVFDELGLEPWFRYQKYREEFSAEGVVIALDETPVGTFVEIEGTEDGILAATAALGRSPDQFILASYRSLFAARAASSGFADRDMLFPPS